MPPAAATSLPAAGSTAPAGSAAGRQQVRRRTPTLVAQEVEHPGLVETVTGGQQSTLPGDWLLRRNNQIVEVVSASRLLDTYERVEEGGLRLPARDCHAIEEILGLGSTQSASALCLAVDRLAKIEVGEIRIAFTPGQLEELRFRATKRGHTFAQEVQAVVDRVRDELFYRS